MCDYREILIDSHITDWNKNFLSKFNSRNYVDMLSIANVSSAMLYVSCHNGNCYYPTKIGHQHKNLNGRDIVGEIITLCNKKNIDVVLYYSLIYNNWVYKNFPDWRIINVSGIPTGEQNRYGVVCPNSPYRNFAIKQIREICERYRFKRMFFDMTFWPDVCYCKYCRNRFKKETGSSLPNTIKWDDKNWIVFQRKREEWLKEFASVCTATVKAIKPEVDVTHNFAVSILDWKFGVTDGVTDECDYTSGDFYGDSTRHSLACKLFTSLSKKNPFEFFVSRCGPNLSDHTTTKSQELMETQAFQVIAHLGRVIFIDAINPDGTLEKNTFDRIGKIYKKIKKYEKHLKGEPVYDIGLYYSFESKISFEENNKKIKDIKFDINYSPYVSNLVNVNKTLISNHIPYGIITRKNLKEISKYKAIILPNVVMMDNEEKEAIERYVKNGGSIYASKYTSLFDKHKGKRNDFMLKELFGVSFKGITNEKITYITLPDGLQLVLFSEQAKVSLIKGKVFANLTLPYTNPEDTKKFASIHSNPPGIKTSYPSIVMNKYGKGRVCYVSGELESYITDVHPNVFINLLNELSGGKYSFETDAPKSVEVLLFKQRETDKYLVNLINFQQELPNVPIKDIKIKIRLNNAEKPVKLILVSENKKCNFKFNGNVVEFLVPEINTFLMYELYIKKRGGV